MNIFEECKTNNIDSFLEKYHETRDLTFEEIKIMNNLCNAAINLQFYFVIGPKNVVNMPCIFKSNNLWIVWHTNDKGAFFYEKAFDNILDAGYYLFNLCLNIGPYADEEFYDLAVRHFNRLQNQEVDEKSILKLADCLGSNIIDLNTYKLKKD